MDTRRRLARRTALAALLVVAMGTSACSGNRIVGTAPAATVGDTTISRADLDRQLTIDKAYARAEARLQGQTEALAKATAEDFVGAGTDTVPATKTSEALRTLIQLAVLREAVDAEGGKVTDADRKEARDGLTSNIESQGIDLAKLPKSFIDQQVEFAATQLALAKTIEVTDSQLQAAYEASGDAFTQICVSVIYVGDEATALAALDRVEAGEDFGAVSAEVSIDDTIKQRQGAIGCESPTNVAQQLGPDIATAEVDEPLAPVQDPSQSGWLVSMVTSRQVSSLEDVTDQLTKQVQSDRLPGLLDPSLEDVHVDPRYGTWDAATASVVPPVVPPTPNTTTTTITVPIAPTSPTAPTAGS